MTHAPGTPAERRAHLNGRPFTSQGQAAANPNNTAEEFYDEHAHVVESAFSEQDLFDVWYTAAARFRRKKTGKKDRKRGGAADRQQHQEETWQSKRFTPLSPLLE
jgi:hypothetical protein